jgi:diguanylate cyclase (GGDEF)-like protein/PAS domain S-box-containing protein
MLARNRPLKVSIVSEEEDIYRERLGLALEAAGLDLWENNLTTGEVTLRVSRTLADLGYSEQESLRYMDDLFALVHPDDVERVKESIARHLAGEVPSYRVEFRLRSRDGHWVWYANYGKIMDTQHEQLGSRFIGVTFNVHERKQREEELLQLNQRLAEQNSELARMNESLQTLASTDPLTGLANRRELLETGAKECQRASRTGQPLTLLILDLDHFKRINDSWGHQAGDEVLVAVAELCRSRFRQGIDVTARIGGEEFAVLMPDTAFTEAMRIAEWVRMALEARQISIGQGAVVTTTFSIGVATTTVVAVRDAPHLAVNFSDLMKAADRALYRAKEGGRNQVQGIELQVV